ncbi:MAG: arginine decarboxylase [Bacteroidetes bacterium GWF2_38_335]|nr:MAG: arginine decarboxylase [Bacteroidetes bacterium GWF2_38_335]OFY79935.1 MAG: arginine decarboxylase [Bacteroidetes bacterium RIFOXYA12_FULL_38_20]HBS86393.1 arginine decarboxylase [Bacteroidales bacterium]
MKKILVVLIVPLILSACAPVKGYQKMYINDSEMELSAKKIEKFEMNFKLYREGTSGANGGKSGGGCGCN